MLALFISLALSADESGSSGPNISYTFITGNNFTLTISGSGPMMNYKSSSEAPWLKIESSIINLIIEENITTVGDYSFYYINTLKSVVLPSTIETIGIYSFYRCPIRSLDLPNISSIGNYAFYSCQWIKSLTIPRTVRSIRIYAFYNLYGMYNITFEEGLETIGNYAFCNATRLSKIIFSEGLVSIGNYSFCQCENLIELTIPNSVKTIENIHSVIVHIFILCFDFKWIGIDWFFCFLKLLIFTFSENRMPQIWHQFKEMLLIYDQTYFQ